MDMNNELMGNKKIDFMEVSQGLACWESCNPQESNVYAAYVKVRVLIKHEDYIAISRLRDFIKALFQTNEVHEASDGSWSDITFTICKQNLSVQKEAEEWLANCTILNTYSAYFTATTGIYKIRILYGINSYENEAEMQKAMDGEIFSKKDFCYSENLAINDIVYVNTSAEKELGTNPLIIAQDAHRWYAYNLFYSKLSEKLYEKLNG